MSPGPPAECVGGPDNVELISTGFFNMTTIARTIKRLTATSTVIHLIFTLLIVSILAALILQFASAGVN